MKTITFLVALFTLTSCGNSNSVSGTPKIASLDSSSTLTSSSITIDTLRSKIANFYSFPTFTTGKEVQIYVKDTNGSTRTITRVIDSNNLVTHELFPDGGTISELHQEFINIFNDLGSSDMVCVSDNNANRVAIKFYITGKIYFFNFDRPIIENPEYIRSAFEQYWVSDLSTFTCGEMLISGMQY